MTVRISCIGLSFILAANQTFGAVTFIGASALPGGGSNPQQDYSNLGHTLLGDSVNYQDSFDGAGSAIAYTGFGNRYLLLPDRGPNKVVYNAAVDNTNDYKNRFQIVDIALSGSGNSYTVKPILRATSLLTNEAGQNFTGLSTAFAGSDSTQNLRLDSEGARVAADGTVWICDEYGPNIYHFDQTGRRIGILGAPANLQVASPKPTVTAEAAANTSGRYPNRGAEGLAISPDGKTMVVAMQSAAIQDGGLNGTKCRFLVYDLTSPAAAPKELEYNLDSKANVVSEIVAVNNHQFLVDERDQNGGATGTPPGVKKLYSIDLDQAAAPTDITSVAALPQTGITPSVTPLAKSSFADIGALLNAANPYVAGSGGLPDKIEGYAFGPDLPDGRHLLLATNDNDFSTIGATTYANYIFAFAVDSADLPGFIPNQLNSGVTFIPEPTALFAVLLAVPLLTRSRRHGR